MHTFYRVRVGIDVAKPLKKQMKMKRDNGSWVVIDFRYERLPTFCFLCSIIRHGKKYYHKVLRGADLRAEKPYGSWLRAGLRRGVPSTGHRWIPPVTTVERRSWTVPIYGGMDNCVQTNKEDQNNEGNVSAEKGKDVLQLCAPMNDNTNADSCVELDPLLSFPPTKAIKSSNFDSNLRFHNSSGALERFSFRKAHLCRSGDECDSALGKTSVLVTFSGDLLDDGCFPARSPLNPDYDSDYAEFLAEFLADDSLGNTPPASPATPDTTFPAPETDHLSPPSQTPSMVSADSPAASA
nr:uncharacterized protein LOC109174453 [Ipomoea batatas]